MTRGPLARQVDFCSCVRCGNISSAAFVFDDGTFYCNPCWDYIRSNVQDLSNASACTIDELRQSIKKEGDFNVVQKDCSEVGKSGEVQEDVS